MTSIATTRMMPTAWRLTTIVRATSARNRYSSRPTLMPEAAAPSGSNVAYRSSFHRSATIANRPAPEDQQRDEVLGADREHVAQQERPQVRDVPVDRAEQEHAEGERPGEQHADRGVLADARALRHPADREGGAHGGDRRADVERDAEHVRDDDARERRHARSRRR